MFEDLLKHNNLGTKDELLFLLFKALPLSASQKVSDIKKYCTSNHFSIGKSFDGILQLLEFMSFITVIDGLVSINNRLFNPSKIKKQKAYFEQQNFVRCFFSALKREDVITEFIRPDAIKQDIDRGLYYLKDSLVPVQFFGIRNLLLSIGVFERDTRLGSNNLLVSRKATKLFDSIIVNSLIQENKRKNRRRSLSELKKQQDRQQALGKAAEIYVQDFEKRRLHGHPSIEKVQRISEEYVNAGYDIESFADLGSVFLDRFIEVKSYSGTPEFYWSQNEVDIAKELGEKYFLYLVSRDEMMKWGYSPQIIQDPYKKIFLDEYWVKEPGTWKITMPFEKSK